MTTDEMIAEIKPELLEALKILMLHQRKCSVTDDNWGDPHTCNAVAPRILMPIPAGLFEDGANWDDVLAQVSAWKWVASAKEYDNEVMTNADGDIVASFQNRRTLEVISKPLRDITFED